MREVYDGGTRSPAVPLSRAIGAGEFVFVSGTIGLRDDGYLADTTIGQTAQALDNISAHLSAAGLTMDDVVTVTVYLARPEDFEDMNQVYRRYFSHPEPTRTTVCPRLVFPEHLVEIAAIAYRRRQPDSGDVQ